MNILELSAKAQKFYETGRSRTLVSGYERNVLVRPEFENGLFVDVNYHPKPGDYIFRCSTINQQTVISLKTAIPMADKIEIIALKGKFTQQEWLHMLERMNGILYTPELEPRNYIAGEMDEPVLEEKIMAMTITNGTILLREIQRFWQNHLSVEPFVNQYL